MSRAEYASGGAPVRFRPPRAADAAGFASLIALFALSIFCLIAFYMALDAATELRQADNFESHAQASYAALAGLNHARVLLRGLDPDDILKGPDGSYDDAPAYLDQARTFGFRNPIDWATARTLDLADPSDAVGGLPDDGLINTGKFGVAAGTALIPISGVLQSTSDPYGPGTRLLARYFVKVTDNSGESSELAGDPSDNPFVDGDGTFIVRSMGIAQTIRETMGGGVARVNSVVVYEGRFRQRRTFDLGAPLVLQGTEVQAAGSAMFAGNKFTVSGGAGSAAIATIDPDPGDASVPFAQVAAGIAPNQYANIQGLGMSPSVIDVTAAVRANADNALVLDPAYLENFAARSLPQFADGFTAGNQTWSQGAAPDLGAYDYTRPYNDPAQNPRAVLVDGDVTIQGNLTGGGLLVIRGKVSGSGTLGYSGLILVIGAGEINLEGLDLYLHGGL